MTFEVTQPFVHAPGGSVDRDLVYREAPSVDGSELVLPFRDPGELRVPLPAVGTGGVKGVRVIRDSSDERKGTLQQTLDGATWTSVREVALPEPNPRILRRFAFYPWASGDPIRELTADDFTGQYGSSSYTRDIVWAAPPDPQPRSMVFGFAMPVETVADEYYAAAGDLPVGTALGELARIDIIGTFNQQLYGRIIPVEFETLEIAGRSYRVWKPRTPLAGAFLESPMRSSLAWSNIPS